MEIMIKMSAAEADEAMTKGLMQALVYPFSCREEVRRAAVQKAAEKVKVEPKAEPKKAEKPEKVEKVEMDEKVEAEPEKAPEAQPKKTEEEKPKYTLDQLSKAAADLITSNAESQTKLLELLKKFSVESLPELKPENYTEFGEELKAVGGKL